jgi:hypothetical protein
MHTASPGYESECIRGPIVVDPKAGQVEQHTRNLAEIAAAHPRQWIGEHGLRSAAALGHCACGARSPAASRCRPGMVNNGAVGEG